MVKVAASEDLKRPLSPYFAWLNANRAEITAAAGGTSGPAVTKKAAEMWKALPADKKKPYEEQYKKDKEKYEAYLKTPEGEAGLKALKEERQAAKDEDVKKAAKKAAKSVEKDDKLKKPVSAYWLWLGANREAVTKAAGSNNVSAMGKKAGEMWNALAEKDKAPFEKEAKTLKEQYEAYIKTPEGEAALKAFKDAQAAAKAEVTGTVETEQAKSPKKRKAEEGDSPKGKRTKSGSAPPATSAITAEQRVKAGELADTLEKLAGRADIQAKGCSVDDMLGALRSNGGLLHPSKRSLLGA